MGVPVVPCGVGSGFGLGVRCWTYPGPGPSSWRGAEKKCVLFLALTAGAVGGGVGRGLCNYKVLRGRSGVVAAADALDQPFLLFLARRLGGRRQWTGRDAATKT